MAVDLAKPPHIVVVHGVQRGAGMNIKLDQTVRRLVDRVLKQSHITEDYAVRQYVYEDMNDAHPTVRLAQLIARAISRGRPLTAAQLVRRDRTADAQCLRRDRLEEQASSSASILGVFPEGSACSAKDLVQQASLTTLDQVTLRDFAVYPH